MRWTGSNWGWSDGSTIKYYNWRQGEPNNWGGQVEDCVEQLNDGQWNDELCNQTVPYICKKPAQTEYCSAATTSGNMKRCGEWGVDEDECRHAWGCCWNGHLEVGMEGHHCFQPSKPIDVGMAAGAAVAVTLVVTGLAFGAYIYYTKYYSPSLGDGGFSNPAA